MNQKVQHFFRTQPFFFQSGYFLVNNEYYTDIKKWYVKVLKKRIFTLLIPYFSIIIIHWLAIDICKLIMNLATEGENIDNNISYSLSNIISHFGICIRQPHPAIFWFIRCLMLFIVISPLVVMVCKNKILGCLILALIQMANIILYCNWPEKEIYKIFWDYFFFLRGYLFFCSGIYLRMHPVKKNILTYKKEIALLAILLSGTRIILELYHIYAFSAGIVCFELPIWMTLVYSIMTDRQLSKHIISSSFAIYIMHPYILIVIQKVESKIMHPGIWCEYLSIYVLTAVITYALCIFISVVLNKCLPKVSFVLFGGRIK